jgi:type IV conjugative transfer system coupling protein TraD
MAILRQDALGTLSQGLTRGRHFLHDVFVQMVLFAMIALVTLGGWSYQWWSELDGVQQDYWWLWLKAHLAVWLGFPQIDINYLFENRWQSQSAGDIAAWQSLNDYVTRLHDGFWSLWTLPVAIGSSAWLALAWYLYQLGGNQVDHDVIEGVQLVSPAVYKKTVGKQASNIQLGNVPWVKDAEVQHLLISGDPGTGKSQLLSQLLQQIRKRGDLAIIYDAKQDFVRDFFDAGKDVLLSPFDARSVDWDVWSDITTQLDAETFAEAVIKENISDPFWSKAARMVLVAALGRGKRDGLSIKATLDKLMTADLETLKTWLAHTEVSADFSNEKTAASILSELKGQMRALRYLPEVSSSGFSLKAWLSERLAKSDGGWLFLPLPESVKSVGTPIVAAQLELLANHILSQTTNSKRRIWFIVDELPSLPKLSVLGRLLAQGRGYGVAGVLALQNFSQLKSVYGNDGAHALAGLCSSLFSLRISDPETAKYVSSRLGKQLRREMHQNQSHSRGKTNSVSQGQSESINERSAVSDTTLMKLPDLQGVLSSKGIASPVSVKVSVQKLAERNEPWIPVAMANLGANDKTRTSTHSVDNDGVVAPPVTKAWDI